MEFIADSYCGIACGKCPVLLANQNGTLEELAKERNMPIEDVTCFGCKSGQATIWCSSCEIKTCAKAKQIEYCFSECQEYPCERIFSHTNVPVFRKDSYCGLYCGACELFLATQNGTLDILAEQRNMTPEELRCYGCKSGKNSTYCTSCSIKQCAREKHFEFCVQCQNYPCDPLRAFQQAHPHKLPIFRNLQTIQEQGVAAWLEAQQQRWNCSNCGACFAYYDEFCGKCGQRLDNCHNDAENLNWAA